VQRCTPGALALYLFWVTAGDADGLSFYSDSSISRLLSMDLSSVREAKRVLVSAELIAVESPLVQVLSSEPWVPTKRANQASSIGEILKAGGVHNVRFRLVTNLFRVGVATHWVAIISFIMFTVSFFPTYWIYPVATRVSWFIVFSFP